MLAAKENESFYQADYVITPGSLAELSTVATGLYDALRQFDQYDVDLIYSEVFPTEGIGKAIMNRLFKAAGQNIIEQKLVKVKKTVKDSFNPHLFFYILFFFGHA